MENGTEAGKPMSGCRVGYIVGSLSTKSINRTLAKALIGLAPKHVTFAEIPIRDLPLYNYDFDTDYPPAGRALKDAISSGRNILTQPLEFGSAHDAARLE